MFRPSFCYGSSLQLLQQSFNSRLRPRSLALQGDEPAADDAARGIVRRGAESRAVAYPESNHPRIAQPEGASMVKLLTIRGNCSSASATAAAAVPEQGHSVYHRTGR